MYRYRSSSDGVPGGGNCTNPIVPNPIVPNPIVPNPIVPDSSLPLGKLLLPRTTYEAGK